MATYIRGEPVKLSECHIPQHHALKRVFYLAFFFVDHANMAEQGEEEIGKWWHPP